MNDNRWKAGLWEFFAAGIGFWILKTDASIREKAVLGLVTILMVTLLVFA
jgi:hypothetical protein